MAAEKLGEIDITDMPDLLRIVEEIRQSKQPRLLKRKDEELAVTIICSLEGALMMSRLQRNKDAMRAVQLHLEKYLESEIRGRSSKTRSR